MVLFPRTAAAMPVIGRRALLGAMLALPAAGLPPRETVAAIERGRLLPQAVAALRIEPRTITAVPAPRSPGGAHDYYSEGDYWWPDPADPGGRYIRRDGQSNPDKFDGHRDALIAFGRVVPTLAAAWRLTGDARFAHAACRHMAAWFVTPATRMTPNLIHAQAVIGVNTGRAIGIIDTLQIVEVALAARLLADRRAPGYAAIRRGVEAWFAAYLEWLTTSAPGIEERDQRNNHGTCWLLQATAFARAARRDDLDAGFRQRLVDTILPTQIATDGRQPLELKRTKPYAYSLFNMDVLAGAAWLLSPEGRGSLLRVRSAAGGGSVLDAVRFMAPYIADRARWPFAHDIEYFEDFPVRHPALLFGSIAGGDRGWETLWRGLPPDPQVPEVVRNFPIRQPMLWLRGELSGVR